MRASSPLPLVLLACTPTGAPPTVDLPPAPAAPASPPARRCLALVEPGCSCVYDCGLGTEVSPGRWSVEHRDWERAPVPAHIDRWCAQGLCADAFFSELPCSGQCGPREAETGCIVVDDHCEHPARPLVRPTRIPTWPFIAWDSAEAITYNHFTNQPAEFGAPPRAGIAAADEAKRRSCTGCAMRGADEAGAAAPNRPEIQLRVHDDDGWSHSIVERRPLTAAQSRKTVEWTLATGERELWKCPLPRHAVVYYHNERPIASVSISFECGDILVWPALDPAANTDTKLHARRLESYEQVLPQWQQFFRDEVGFPLDPVPRP